ncbi:MAG: relaxase/mobilization nuclease domain-containing protein [Pseudobdellovibrionaceae bacterium]
MAIVKLEKVKNLERYDEYIHKDREVEISESAPEGLEGKMMPAIHDEHARLKNKRVEHLAFTVYQSWHPNESNAFPVEKYTQMGRELAEKFAPGHLAWVTTHTDKKHIHNHITICSIHSETGKALDRRREDFKRLHTINNEIAKENGLALNLPRTNNPNAKLPPGVHKLLAKGKKSWVLDMVQKIDFARAGSTSFDDYVGQLKTLGVDARIDNKNISYFYGDHKKAVRGKTLGNNFDKDGLMKAFRENDEKFAQTPGLREQIRSDIGAAFDGKGHPVGTPSNLLLESASHPGLRKKDYGKFTKIERPNSRNDLPAIFDERGGTLYQEMKRAQKMSILDYCVQQKIKTKLNTKGETVLSGREFVVIKDNDWTNTKNRTKGTIIDFVAIHDETNYLRAIAKINNTPRILILEQAMGEQKRGFQSFYIPKPKAAMPEIRKKSLTKLLESHGYGNEAADVLFKNKNVHVGTNGGVLFMNEKEDSAMEFCEESNGKWKPKRHGKPAGSFFEQITKSKQMLVFRDPFDFALFSAKGAVRNFSGANIFVMFDENSHRRLDEVLALNPHIQSVHMAHSGNPKEHERSKTHDMIKRFDPFDIQIKELSLSDASKARGRGPDISM